MCGWFIEINLVRPVYLCFCVSAPRIVITSGMMWRDMDPYDWLKKVYSFNMAAVVNISSRRGLTIEEHHRNQHNKSKLVLCKR